ncbi:MAG: hypothetical protein J3R72DRAFT_430163 [Linnemannia gamsii]|nr:MAG: hypothetical protein J3R72DRAFT_430163 [Linnemannia gamsii]
MSDLAKGMIIVLTLELALSVMVTAREDLLSCLRCELIDASIRCVLKRNPEEVTSWTPESWHSGFWHKSVQRSGRL